MRRTRRRLIIERISQGRCPPYAPERNSSRRLVAYRRKSSVRFTSACSPPLDTSSTQRTKKSLQRYQYRTRQECPGISYLQHLHIEFGGRISGPPSYFQPRAQRSSAQVADLLKKQSQSWLLTRVSRRSQNVSKTVVPVSYLARNPFESQAHCLQAGAPRSAFYAEGRIPADSFSP